jgi:hypothetical protein
MNKAQIALNIALNSANTLCGFLSQCKISYLIKEINGCFYIIFIHPDCKIDHSGLSIKVFVDRLSVIPGLLYGSYIYYDLRFSFEPIDWKNDEGIMKFTIRNLDMVRKGSQYEYDEATHTLINYSMDGINEREQKFYLGWYCAGFEYKMHNLRSLSMGNVFLSRWFYVFGRKILPKIQPLSI